MPFHTLFASGLVFGSGHLAQLDISGTSEESISLLQLAAKTRGQQKNPLDSNYGYYSGIQFENGYENYCGMVTDVHTHKLFGHNNLGTTHKAGNRQFDYSDVGGVFAVGVSADRSVEIQGFSCPSDRPGLRHLTGLQGLALKVDGDLVEVHYQPMDITKTPAVGLADTTIADFYDRARALCTPHVGEAAMESALRAVQNLDMYYYEQGLRKPTGYFNDNMWEFAQLDRSIMTVFNECDQKAVQRDYTIWINGVEKTNEAPAVLWAWSGNGLTETFPIPGADGLRWSQASPGSRFNPDQTAGRKNGLSPRYMFKKGTPGNQGAKVVVTVVGTRQGEIKNFNKGGSPHPTCYHCPPPARDSSKVRLKPVEGGVMMHVPLMEFGIWINPKLTGGPLPIGDPGKSLCNAVNDKFFTRENVASDSILFSTGARKAMCEVCNWPGSPTMPRVDGAGGWFDPNILTHCPMTNPVPPTPTPPPPPPEVCDEEGIDMADAEAACEHLSGTPELFDDCVTDYCMSGGNPGVEALEEIELQSKTTTTTTTTTTLPPTTLPPTTLPATTVPPATTLPATTLPATTLQATTLPATTLPATTLPPTTTNPEISACPCTDPPTLTLKTPAYSNLANAGPDVGFPEGILYPDAGVIHGKAVNVHLQATSSYSGKASMNGVKGSLGRLNLMTGSTLSFTVSVKDAETGEKINVGNLPVTFLDLDEGKRGSGRTTVLACNAERFMSNPTELVAGDINGCSSVTSSTAGTAKDNPASVEGALVDSVARMRVASFVAVADEQNQYAFTIQIGKGWKQRGVLFALSSGLACAEGNLPATCVEALATEEQGRQPRVNR